MLIAREGRMVVVFDMKHLRKVLEVGVMRNIKNRDIRGRCENKAFFLKRMDQSTLR